MRIHRACTFFRTPITTTLSTREDDDILGRLLRVPGGCVCGQKLPTLIRSSMVFYTCVAANNECPSYMSSSDGAAKH